MSSMISELKRRNVFRVGAAYLVVGWLLIQVVATVAPRMALPEWVPGVIIIFLLVGFPVALLFAWAFELTPEGLKKTAEVTREGSIASATGRKLDFAIIGALILALGYFVWESRFAGAPETADNGLVTEARAAEASIAVLPFVNMSDDASNEYFSEGISEEILNVLAKVPDLRVTSRSSSFTFKGKDVDIPTVARQLGVNHVLEGSVRKSGVRVRITAQLIDARTDTHLWSETYDRDLTDIFAVQDEISAAIVAALSKTMGLKEKTAPKVTAAASPEAYNAYLLGQFLIKKRTKADIEASIPHFERAIKLDPDYAPAHAALGLAWRLLMRQSSSYGTLTLEQMLAKSLPHVERALALDGKLAEAHGVMGLILEAQGKQEQALDHYKVALGLNPSLTNVRNWYSAALGNLGRQGEAFQQIEIAYRLDPLSRLTSNNYANDLLIRRRFDDLGPVLERLDQIAPVVAATFRGLALGAQHRAADGAITILRGIDASPGVVRLKALVAGGLQSLGLEREALRLWPYPNGGWKIIEGGTDYPRTLVMAKEKYEGDPDNPATLASLAWAYFNVGETARAEKMAARHLARLDPAARAIATTNLIPLLGAVTAGDEATARARGAPLEAAVDAALAAGIDIAAWHWAKAEAAFAGGRADEAYEHAARALSMTPLSPVDLDFPYRHFGWDKIPRFVALRDDYLAYLATERQKLLAVACGEGGFKSWQPLPETCATLDQPQ